MVSTRVLANTYYHMDLPDDEYLFMISSYGNEHIFESRKDEIAKDGLVQATLLGPLRKELVRRRTSCKAPAAGHGTLPERRSPWRHL